MAEWQYADQKVRGLIPSSVKFFSIYLNEALNQKVNNNNTSSNSLAVGRRQKMVSNLKRRNQSVRHKLRPDVELGKESVGALVLHEAGEALVQPQVGPPFHSDQVPWKCEETTK